MKKKAKQQKESIFFLQTVYKQKYIWWKRKLGSNAIHNNMNSQATKIHTNIILFMERKS